MITSIQATPARPLSAADLQMVAGVTHETRSGGDVFLSVASGVGCFAGLYDAGKAALGHGTAGTPLQVLGAVGSGIGIYQGVKSLATHVTPEAVNVALKDANGGKDLDVADARTLASNMTGRAHLDGGITVGANVALGAALLTGNVPLGLGAIVLKVAGLAYGVVSSVQTIKDVAQVIQKNAPSPAPAPTAAKP